MIELDEGFFSTETPLDKKGKKLKAGAGSQKKSKVLVIAESSDIDNHKPGKKTKKVGHIKMIVLPNMKATTISDKAVKHIEPDSSIITDASSSHTNFRMLFGEHKSQVIDTKDIGKLLPWVHIAIANAKTLFADTYHGVKSEILQEYLISIATSSTTVTSVRTCLTDFEHRKYNSKAA